jgi:hypothetical protein
VGNVDVVVVYEVVFVGTNMKKRNQGGKYFED